MLSQGPSWNTNIQDSSQIEWFEFVDGTRLSRADFLTLTYFAGTAAADDIRGTIYDDTISGGVGNDTLRGGDGNDTYLIDKGQGDKLIVEGGGSNDTIRFAAGIALADILAVASNADGDSHYDLTFSFANGTGSFTIEDMLSQGPSWATNIQSTSQIEWFEFDDGTRLSRADFLRQTYFAGTSGNDNIQGTFFDDTMTGGLGNDTLSGLSGNDTYLVDVGQGDDRILEGYNYSNDRMIFAAGITLADLQASLTDTDGNGVKDLTISFASGTGSITLEEVFRTDSWAHDRQADWFEFADGTVMSHEQFFAAVYYNGTAGDDLLLGTTSNDTFTGSLGNDRMEGLAGNDTYLVDVGQGDDQILEGWNYTNDRIIFAAGIGVGRVANAVEFSWRHAPGM
jgi:Ca2+-binding RTX toxin-like protein